ncbi:TonB-dependent siderophore receptor [Microbulbifer sp. YPW1]|uniref:TonB-dependent receptor family protein n=1 Tax=Microbulbifer sp. YPW1 TaxID=2745199 RepID=UPI00159B4E5F|nr:TonB-dependent siderophore receptor [Microbulbifer sp. YPW1]QKX17337.1 TonB-dependent siderophore receptor [Microbulbifer sp. YPW1]
MQNTSKFFPRSMLSCAILASAIGAVGAQAADRETEPAKAKLEEVQVTGNVLGNSLPEEVLTYPGNRSLLTAEQLQKMATLSIDDGLQRVPGVKIQDESGTGVLPNVAVRGLNASRSGYTQFLVDGIPLTLAPYGHTGQSLFPAALKSLDRIDIVRGGAAVQYGPNNVGGVINLVTKPIPQRWETSLQEKLTSFSGGNMLTDTYARTGGALNDQFSIQLEGNLISGDSFRDHSDTSVKNWLVKSRWNIDAGKQLDLTLQRYDADTEMPGALTADAYAKNREQSLRPNDEFQGDTTRFSAHYKQQLGELGFADAGTFEWMTFAHSSTRNFQWDFSTDPSANHWADPAAPATLLRSSPREFDVWGTEPRVSLQFAGDVSHTLTFGSRLVKEAVDYKLVQTVIDTGATATPRDWLLETSAIAAFVSDEIRLLDKRLSVTPGLRYESVDMDFTDVGNDSAADNRITELLPGISVGFEASDKLFLYANTQRSLRAPQIAVIRGTGDEGAELAWNYEAGIRFEPAESASVSASLYRIDFTDQLLYNSSEQSFDNVGETRHQGLELEGVISPSSLPALQLHMAYNYLDSEQREGANIGKELPYASEHQLSWDASYALADVDITLSGFYFSSAYSDQANTEEELASGTTGKLPAYTVWNLQVSKVFTRANGSELYTGLSANNLLNDEYYFRGIDVSPSGRYPAPPRSISAELKYTF